MCLIRVGHLQTQPITAAFLKETFLHRFSPDRLPRLDRPRTHAWLWARGWERAPLDAREHPGLGDGHPPAAELCRSQVPWLKTNASGFPRAHRSTVAMKQNKMCQEAKKLQPRKGAMNPFFGRGIGIHGVQCRHSSMALRRAVPRGSIAPICVETCVEELPQPSPGAELWQCHHTGGFARQGGPADPE